MCIVLFICCLNQKFQASSHLKDLYRPVLVGPGRKHENRFSHGAARMSINCSGISHRGSYYIHVPSSRGWVCGSKSDYKHTSHNINV